jgi:hypothetical protein
VSVVDASVNIMTPSSHTQLFHSRVLRFRALQLFVVAQEIIAVALACFPTVAIRFATLMLSIFSSLMAVIPAIVVMFRRNDAPRGQEAPGDQRVKRNPCKHGFSPFVLDDLAVQRTVIVVGSILAGAP